MTSPRAVQRATVLAAMAKDKKRSKYRSVRCEVDGEKFDSKREMNRWLQLRTLMRASEIHTLRRQVTYLLDAPSSQFGGTLVVGRYIADFDYYDKSGQHVTEDCKGVRTPLYKWKARHFEAQYGREILET